MAIVANQDILSTIAARRRERIAGEGHAFGRAVPELRRAPIVSFAADPCLICEIKRKSPSRGDIAASLDPVEQAGIYVAAGVRSVSVLTEEDWFSGSLDDLMAVKNRFPNLAVLRKDFLLDVEDVDVSFRAGADAILLIAALLDAPTLETLYRRARELGMTPLVEVHSREEVRKISNLRPILVGVNSRNLSTFSVDVLGPVQVRPAIDWECRTLFESGIRGGADVRLARRAGYDGILVGEAVVRNPELVPGLVSALSEPRAAVGSDFWGRLVRSDARPLVKICGLSREEDVRLADDCGADALGFVFAESPRRADPQLVRRLAPTRALRVGVVVQNETNPNLPAEVMSLLAEGALDAVQFHGDEDPAFLSEFPFPFYKAVRVKDIAEAGSLDRFPSPRILLEAFSQSGYGGTGRRVDPEIVTAVVKDRPLWLAGGLSDENVAEVVSRFHPELVDASSRLESEPGKKDHRRVRSFFRALGR